MNTISESVQKRFFSKIQALKKVDPSPEVYDDCWLWLGGCTKKGYGALWFNGKAEYAHRIAYWIVNGISSIPSYLCIHHKCMRRHCVNPDHIELVPYSVNNHIENRWPNG
jgi:hypothetical protein